jgi:hypothetical protein
LRDLRSQMLWRRRGICERFELVKGRKGESKLIKLDATHSGANRNATATSPPTPH